MKLLNVNQTKKVTGAITVKLPNDGCWIPGPNGETLNHQSTIDNNFNKWMLAYNQKKHDLLP